MNSSRPSSPLLSSKSATSGAMRIPSGLVKPTTEKFLNLYVDFGTKGGLSGILKQGSEMVSAEPGGASVYHVPVGDHLSVAGTPMTKGVVVAPRRSLHDWYHHRRCEAQAGRQPHHGPSLCTRPRRPGAGGRHPEAYFADGEGRAERRLLSHGGLLSPGHAPVLGIPQQVPPDGLRVGVHNAPGSAASLRRIRVSLRVAYGQRDEFSRVAGSHGRLLPLGLWCGAASVGLSRRPVLQPHWRCPRRPDGIRRHRRCGMGGRGGSAGSLAGAIPGRWKAGRRAAAVARCRGLPPWKGRGATLEALQGGLLHREGRTASASASTRAWPWRRSGRQQDGTACCQVARSCCTPARPCFSIGTGRGGSHVPVDWSVERAR